METQNRVPDLSTIDNTVEALRYGFNIGSLNFIFDVQMASELLKGVTIAAIPNTPTWMLGVINLRGHLVPVFNLAAYFEFKDEPDNQNLLLVLDKGEKAVAFQVQRYPQLLDNLVKRDSLPELNSKIDGYILTAYNSAENIWLELDKEKFFSALGEKVGV